MTAPPTWLLVVLAVALVVVVVTLRDYEAQRRRRSTVMGLDNEGRFRTMTFEEANAERRARGDVPLAPYTWETYFRDKREGYGWVIGSLLGDLGR